MTDTSFTVGAEPNDPIPEVTEALDVRAWPYKRGPCHTPEESVPAPQDADVSICYHEPYTREVLAYVPRLKGASAPASAWTLSTWTRRPSTGSMVANFPEFCTREVANHVIVLMVACVLSSSMRFLRCGAAGRGIHRIARARTPTLAGISQAVRRFPTPGRTPRWSRPCRQHPARLTAGSHVSQKQACDMEDGFLVVEPVTAASCSWFAGYEVNIQPPNEPLP